MIVNYQQFDGLHLAHPKNELCSKFFNKFKNGNFSMQCLLYEALFLNFPIVLLFPGLTTIFARLELNTRYLVWLLQQTFTLLLVTITAVVATCKERPYWNNSKLNKDERKMHSPEQLRWDCNLATSKKCLLLPPIRAMAPP